LPTLGSAINSLKATSWLRFADHHPTPHLSFSKGSNMTDLKQTYGSVPLS